MRARAAASYPRPRLATLLILALIIVTTLPILVFATDFTNSRALQSIRRRAVTRSGIALSTESEHARLERRRVARATIHPTVSSAALSMGLYLAVLIVIAIVGRRLFALRL